MPIAECDKSINRLVIEFKYLDDEHDFKGIVLDNIVTCRVGKQSKRVMKIEVNVNAMTKPGIPVPERTSRAIEQLIGTHSDREDNYRIVKEVIDDYGEYVFPQS